MSNTACITLHNLLEWHNTDANNYTSKQLLYYDINQHTLILYCGTPVHTSYYTVHRENEYKWESFTLDTTLTIDWNILNSTISSNKHYIAIRINESEIKVFDIVHKRIIAARAVKSGTQNNSCMMLNAYFIDIDAINTNIIFVTTLGCELYKLLSESQSINNKRLQHLKTIQISGLFMHWLYNDTLLILDARQKLYTYKLTQLDTVIQFALPFTITKQRNVQLCQIYNNEVPYIIVVDDIKHIVYIYSISFRLNSVLLLYQYNLTLHAQLQSTQQCKYNIQCIDNCIVVCECVSNTVTIIDTFTDSANTLISSTKLNYISSNTTLKQYEQLNVSRILYPNMLYQHTGEQYEGRLFEWRFDYTAICNTIDTNVKKLSFLSKRTNEPYAVKLAVLHVLKQQIDVVLQDTTDEQLSILTHMFVMINGTWDDYSDRTLHNALPQALYTHIGDNVESYVCDIVVQHSTEVSEQTILYHEQHMLITQYDMFLHVFNKLSQTQPCIDIALQYIQTLYKYKLQQSLLLSDYIAQLLITFEQYDMLIELIQSNVLHTSIAVINALIQRNSIDPALQMCQTIVTNKNNVYSTIQCNKALELHITQLLQQHKCVTALRLLSYTDTTIFDTVPIERWLDTAYQSTERQYTFYWTYTWLFKHCDALNIKNQAVIAYKQKFVELYGDIDIDVNVTQKSNDTVIQELPIVFDNHVNV